MDKQVRHTPGPWAVNPVKAQIDEMHGLTPICAMLWPTDLRSEAETEANARRIVAAVNACEGIPTAELEAGIVRDIIRALEEIASYGAQPGDYRDHRVFARLCPEGSGCDCPGIALDVLSRLRGDTDA